MKLHLPHTLRTALLCTFSLLTTLGTSNLYAGGMHSQVSLVTYTDFGQNMGRYRVEGVNELLSSIRQEEGGVVITYIEGHDDYTMDTPMISFESQGDIGAYAAIGYNYIATVDHNGVQNPVFTGRYIDEANSLRYFGVEYRYSQVFRLQAASPDHSATHDYKVTRLSRLITDVTPGTPMPRFNGSDIPAQLKGRMEYRSGSGRMSIWDLDGYSTGLHGAYDYAIGAMRLIDGASANQYGFSTTTATFDPSPNGISADDPLPFIPAPGDSGSPVWVWDDDTRSYLYMGSYQAVGGRTGYATGAIDYTWDALEKFDKAVAVNGSTVHIKGVTATDNDEVVTDDTYTTRLHLGRVTDAGGSTITTYVGVKGNGNEYIHTWLNLAPEKDKASWFAYDSKYYNVGSGRALNTEDLFFNSNMVFKASSAKGNVVEVDEDTDLGIGYLQFAIDPESGLDHAEYTLQSHGTTDDGHDGQRDYMVNSAGFVVEGGVDLHVKLTNTQWDSDANDYYYREWRKVGDGNLYLEGRGSNQILLNVGGPGTTYLRETDGYAAYNVYVGSGATVVTESLDQIARDFTFGYYGGTLDIRGEHAMDWYRSNPNVAETGFSINSFSEDSYITNSQAGTTLTLTYRETGNTEYLGSFVDSENGGAVRIRFDAGSGSTTTLHSIHTSLHNAGSGINVDSGKVVLSGTNTVHALGSENGINTNRYRSADDWHYADMASNVYVAAGTEFELGSHARLTGDVYVYTGGTLIIREGVHSTYEYIEGGLRLEDTTSPFYRRFYGLFGDVETDAGTTVRFLYSDGTTAEQVYTGNLTGGADVYMDLGDGGASLRLSGNNTFSGTKFLSGGGLISDNGLDALGSISTDDQRWRMAEDAFIAANGVSGEGLLGILSRDSQGMLALTQNQATDLNPQGRGYNALYIGALTGNDVRYGTRDAALATATVDGHRKWLLGGGGGNLIVDGLLQDADAELVLGNGYTSGTVTLTNVENIIGSITFKGRVTLAYTDAAALGGNVRLEYTRRMLLADAADTSHVTEGSQGVVLVDKLDGAAPDMRGHAELYIGASNDAQLNGTPQIDDGASYRFGGIDGTLTVNAELADAGGRPTGLVVDGQTYSGGELVLTQAASLTGDVVVRGYDADLLPAGEQRGDITLNLTCDNALADAASVTLQDGTYVKLNGTSQTFRNLNAAAGSVIASATGTGALNVVVDSQAQVDVDGELHFDHLVKQGEGTLTLTGANSVHVYDVQGGALRAASVGSLYASTVNVLGCTSVSFTGSAKGTADTLVNLYEGSELHSESGADVTLQRGLKFLGNATITGPGKISVTTSEFGVQDLTVTLKDANVAISENGTFHQRGTIHAEGNSTLSISGGDKDAGHDYLRVFDHLEVAANSTLILAQTVQETAPTYEIHDLSGQGTLVLSQGNYKNRPAFYKLTSDTDFAGTFKILGNTGYSSHKYMSYTLIQSDNALANAQVQMQGWGKDTGFFTLGIDTENASIKGLSTVSNDHSILMAGATTAATAENIPVSSRRATLTITGSEDKVFAGQVVGGEEGTDNGLSVVMNGTGVQTFSGVSVFNDVSALRGTLKITNTSADSSIKGDLTVARGANLTIGKALTLDDGKTLHVAGDAADASAVLNATLTLAGGTIDFSGTSLGSDSAALTAFSHGAGSVTIAFSDTYGVEEMKEYFLAGGDWQSVAVTGGAHPYLDADFRATSSGLYATLGAREGSHIWAGTAGSRTWNASHFGPDELEFSETDNAVFTDAAQEKAVDVAYSGSIASLIFDNSQEYTVNSIGGTVTADTLRQMGCGTTVVNAGVAAGTLMLEAGELRVRDTALLDAASSISGPGTLGIDTSGSTVSVNDKLSADAPIGTLHIHSGTYASAGQVHAERILVDAGGTFQLQASQSANITANANGGTDAQAIVNLGNNTLSGKLTLAGDTTVTSSGGKLAADVLMDGHLLTTSGNMTINNTALAGRLRVDSGTLTLGNGNYDYLSDITIGSGGTIYLTYGSNITNGVHMAMEDGSVLSSVAGSGTSRLNIDVLGGTAEIQGSWQGNGLNVAGTISGNGTLKLGYNHANRWTVSSTISDGTGEGDTLAVTVESYVTVSGHNTYSGGTTLIDRELTVNSADALGTGGLTVNGGTLVINNGLNVVSVGGTGGAIRLNNGSALTITGNANASYGGSLAEGANILMQGTGSQAFTAAASYGNVDVQSGTLSLNASALAGQVSVAEGAELQLSTDSPALLSSFILNDGTINFTGDNPVLELAADGPFVAEGMGYRDIDGVETPDGNGFAMRGSVLVVNMGENASISGTTATVVFQGSEFELDSDGVAWVGQKSTHSYSVRHGKVTYDEAFVTKSGSIELEAFILATALEETPAELEIVEELPQDAVVQTSDGGGILRLGEGVALDAAHLLAGADVTLVGEGTYAFGLVPGANQSLGRHVSLGQDWNGCLSMSGGAANTKIALNDLSAHTTPSGTAYSAVELAGVTGYLQADSRTYASDIILTNAGDAPALNLADGSSNATYTFTGRISGGGNILRTASSPGTMSYTFSGNDISEWSGVFENSSGRTTNISYVDNTSAAGAENAVIASSVLKSGEGSMTLTYTNASHGLEVQGGIASTNSTGTLDMVLSASTNATFSGGVAGARNLTLNNGAAATFAKAAGFNGTVTANNGTSVQFLAAGDVSAQHSVGTYQTSGGDAFNRDLLVGEGARLTAANIKNNWGMGTLRVDGALNVTTLLQFSSGGNGSTLNNIITGMGTINAAAVQFANLGTYNVTDLHELNVDGATTFNTSAAVNVSASTLNLNGTVTTNRGSLKLMDGAALNINGTSGTNTLLNLTTTAAGRLAFAQGTTNSISGSGSLASAIVNLGNLTLNGTYSLDGFDVSESGTFTGGEQSGNGFLVGDLSIQLVTGGGTIEKGGALALTFRGKAGSFDAATGSVSFAGTGQPQYDTFFVNTEDTAESLAHAREASAGALATVRLTDGTTLNVDLAGGTLNAVEVASSASATLHVAKNATVSTLKGLERGQTLAIEGDSAAVLTLGGASSVQGDLLITHGTVKMGNIQSLGAYNRVASIDATPLRTITVGEQGVLDVNGGETGSDVGYTVTLDGGTLTNTGNDKNYGKRQPVTNLILDSDSKVVAKKTFGLVANAHAATTLALNGHTLEKTGGSAFYIINATVDAGDGGRIRVGEGMLNFNATAGAANRGTLEGTLELAGGNVAGHINLGGDTTFDATAASSDVTADIDTNGHDVHFAGSGDISVHAHSNTGENGSGAISGSGSIVKEGTGTTAISGSMANFTGSIDVQNGVLELFNQNSLNVQDVTIADGAAVGAYVGTEKLDEYEATLTISGTLAAKGADGRLNANVVMETDSTLDASATGGSGIALGSSLTLNGKINLSEADFEAVAGLGYGDRYVLFNGVDSLTLDQTYTEAITPEMQINAAGWFHGIEPEKYYVVYDGSNVGEVAIFCATPEPATSTLSLLALASLAARRRRKD